MPNRSRQVTLGLVLVGSATAVVLDLTHRLLIWDGRIAGASAIAAGVGIAALAVEGCFVMCWFVFELIERPR